MSNAVGFLNVVVGFIYLSYGVMTILDLRRNWHVLGPSHFGFAWVAMAFTCGPHHLEHGLHVLTTDRSGGPLDLATILVGLPAGAAWFALRVEAMLGGRGDRTVSGSPWWVDALPALFGLYVVGLTGGIVNATIGTSTFDARLTPNVLLVGFYSGIAYVLLRTQLRNHQALGTWSVSGLALTLVFSTCAAMHGVWAVYGSTGRYEIDSHLLAIDTAAVPAAAYFLWVVGSLYRGSLRDWNAASDTTPQAGDGDGSELAVI